MAKTAAQVAGKYAERAANAAGDYVAGAQGTSKDQSAAAKAAIPIMKSELMKAIDSGRVARGLDRSGKAGWLAGVVGKGSERFASGVAAGQAKYATNSAKFDVARGAAAALPRGARGSETNLARVKAVVSALRVAKVGSAG